MSEATVPYRYSNGRAMTPRETRVVDKGRAAGFQLGRHGPPAEACPFRIDGPRKRLWKWGFERGVAEGAQERLEVQASYRAGLAALDGPQTSCWRGP